MEAIHSRWHGLRWKYGVTKSIEDEEIESVDALLSEIVELRNVENPGPVFSIYCKAGRLPDDAAKAKIRFKNLLTKVENLIERHDLTGSSKHLAELSKLMEDRDFWNHQNGGLAVFFQADSLRILKLAAPLPQLAHAGASYHLKPLLPPRPMPMSSTS